MHPAILAELGDARLNELHTPASRVRRGRLACDPPVVTAPTRWRIRLGTRVIALGEWLAGPGNGAARHGHLGGAR